MNDEASQIDGAASILEHFTSDNPIHERNASRRILSEVIRAFPGDIDRNWWKWFLEAATSLGLRVKALDCSIDEALVVARDHGQLVCYRTVDQGQMSGDWLAVLSASKRQCQVLLAREFTDHTKLSYRKLRAMLESYAVEGRVRCVIIQPNDEALSSDFNPGGRRLRPFGRLWYLLRPEATDIWMVILFAFVVALLMLATPIAVEALVNTVAFGRFLQPIVILAIILFMFLAFQGAIRALQIFVVEIIQRRLFARVAGDLAFRLPRIELEAIKDAYVPELVNRFFEIVAIQKIIARLMLDGIGLVLTTLIGMAVLAFYHPWLLGFDFFLLSMIAVIIVVLGRGAVSSAIEESKHKYRMASWLEDIAQCPTAFRNDGGADFSLERADRIIHRYLKARRRHFRIVLRQVIFALGLQAIASTILLGLGGWLVISGELTLGQLVAAELIVTVIVDAFAKFGKHMESLYDLLASVDKLGVLFDLPLERSDGMLAIHVQGPASVEVSGVCYRWDGQQDFLRDVTFQIDPGEAIAIRGGAGSGKSTLIDLIYGLRQPSAGYVTVDGFDPRDLRPDTLRRRTALVRKGEVFCGSVAENVHLHRVGVSSTDVRDMLDAVGLLDCILGLPDGSNTVLSSSGFPLSDGQCRLLGIARAAIGRPGLLLIDGTLDELSDEEIDRSLQFLLHPERTWSLMITTARQEIAARFPRNLLLDELMAGTKPGTGGHA